MKIDIKINDEKMSIDKIIGAMVEGYNTITDEHVSKYGMIDKYEDGLTRLKKGREFWGGKVSYEGSKHNGEFHLDLNPNDIKFMCETAKTVFEHLRPFYDAGKMLFGMFRNLGAFGEKIGEMYEEHFARPSKFAVVKCDMCDKIGIVGTAIIRNNGYNTEVYDVDYRQIDSSEGARTVVREYFEKVVEDGKFEFDPKLTDYEEAIIASERALDELVTEYSGYIVGMAIVKGENNDKPVLVLAKYQLGVGCYTEKFKAVAPNAVGSGRLLDINKDDIMPEWSGTDHDEAEKMFEYRYEQHLNMLPKAKKYFGVFLHTGAFSRGYLAACVVERMRDQLVARDVATMCCTGAEGHRTEIAHEAEDNIKDELVHWDYNTEAEANTAAYDMIREFASKNPLYAIGHMHVKDSEDHVRMAYVLYKECIHEVPPAVLDYQYVYIDPDEDKEPPLITGEMLMNNNGSLIFQEGHSVKTNAEARFRAVVSGCEGACMGDNEKESG